MSLPDELHNLPSTLSFFPSLLLILVPIITFFSPSVVQAKTDSLTSMSEKDMRTVTGRKGISFDTVTLDGTLEEELEAITNDAGAGLFLGPVIIEETVIGEGSIYESSGATISGNDQESAVVSEVGPIEASFLTELKFGFAGDGLTSAGGFGVGGFSMSGARVEVTKE